MTDLNELILLLSEELSVATRELRQLRAQPADAPTSEDAELRERVARLEADNAKVDAELAVSEEKTKHLQHDLAKAIEDRDSHRQHWHAYERDYRALEAKLAAVTQERDTARTELAQLRAQPAERRTVDVEAVSREVTRHWHNGETLTHAAVRAVLAHLGLTPGEQASSESPPVVLVGPIVDKASWKLFGCTLTDLSIETQTAIREIVNEAVRLAGAVPDERHVVATKARAPTPTWDTERLAEVLTKELVKLGESAPWANASTTCRNARRGTVNAVMRAYFGIPEASEQVQP